MNNLEQGSPEWLEMRKKYIGASDAATIMGVSPWSTPYRLWQEKLGFVEPQPGNWAMARGIELEPEARAAFCRDLGVQVYPVVVFHETQPFMMASLDGLNSDAKIAVEIKCPGEATHDIAVCGKVPDHYMPQLQHQLACTGLDSMYYYSYLDGQGVAIKVERDDAYIERLIAKEKAFYDCMVNFKAPALSKGDYTEKNTATWAKYGQRLADIDEQIKALTAEKDSIKAELIEDAQGHNAKGGGITLTRVESKGRINYARVPQLKDVDLEQYRSMPTTSWRLTVSNGG